MNNYTVLAFLKNEPIRVKSIIKNFKGRANIIALLDSEDVETESVLQNYNIKYKKRPVGTQEQNIDEGYERLVRFTSAFICKSPLRSSGMR